MKSKYPNYDLHHIMSSSNKKFTDRLVYPLDHWSHLNSVHKNIPYYFEMLLPGAVGHYLNYLLDTKKIKETAIRYYRRNYTPEDLVKLFETVEGITE